MRMRSNKEIDKILKDFTIIMIYILILMLFIPVINDLYNNHINKWAEVVAYSFGWIIAYISYYFIKLIIKFYKNKKEKK